MADGGSCSNRQLRRLPITPWPGLDACLLEPLLFLAAAGSAAAGLLILQLGLQRVFSVAPRLKPAQDVAAPDTSLTVVIPAFNEAHNIEACVASVLANQPPCRDWSVLVVDDESSDAKVDNALRAGSAAPTSD